MTGTGLQVNATESDITTLHYLGFAGSTEQIIYTGTGLKHNATEVEI